MQLFDVEIMKWKYISGMIVGFYTTLANLCLLIAPIPPGPRRLIVFLGVSI
jgi:hypothetical protein